MPKPSGESSGSDDMRGTMRVGFVGLGAMGRPMAENLLRAGFGGERGRAARRVRRRWCRGGPAKHGIGGNGGAVQVVVRWSPIAAMSKRCCWLTRACSPGCGRLGSVDMSTIAPDSARKLAQACRNKGVDFLDAPVSGGVAGASNGTLAIMVGGDEAALERGCDRFSRRWARPSCGSGRAARTGGQGLQPDDLRNRRTGLRRGAAPGSREQGRSGAVREALLGGSAWSRALEGWGEKMVKRDFSGGVDSAAAPQGFCHPAR